MMQHDARIDVREYWRILLRRRWWFLVPVVSAVLTGMVGALSAKYLFDLLRIDSWAVRGFALGTVSHGIGAARALQVHADAGAYAGLALGLQVLLSSLLLPLIFRLVL